MNIRNSIFNKISNSVEVLKEMKNNKLITNNNIEFEISIPETISSDDSVAIKFKVSCDLTR